MPMLPGPYRTGGQQEQGGGGIGAGLGAIVGGFPGALAGQFGQQLLSGLFSGAAPMMQQSGNQTQQLQLAPMGDLEQSLSQGLAGQGQLAFQPGGAFDPTRLANAQLSPEAQQNIQRRAFAGFDEGMRQALSAATANANLRNLPGSSIESQFAGNFTRPLIAQAAQLQAGLETNQLDFIDRLRQSLLGLAAGERAAQFQERAMTGRQTTESTSREGTRGQIARQEQDDAVDRAVAQLTPEQQEEWRRAQDIFAARNAVTGEGIGDQQLAWLRERGVAI